MDMEITFEGNKRVWARYGQFVVATDQPAKSGGDGTAPSPFELFISTIGTCAGFFALDFMQARDIPVEGTRLTLHAARNPKTRLVEEITLDLRLPTGFPEKYKDAIVRAVELCTVQRHLDRPPKIDLVTSIG